MNTSCTEILNHIEGIECFQRERHELYLLPFSNLRKSVSRIASKLDEVSKACRPDEHVIKIRNLMAEWLSTPVIFNNEITKVIENLGKTDEVRNKYGAELSSSCSMALAAVAVLQTQENPMRVLMQRIVAEQLKEGMRVKILCDYRQQDTFVSAISNICPKEVGEHMLITNLTNYCQSSVFDTLIKTGPLRTWGWASAPEAIINAPRYKKLIQLVWAGNSDEPEFGCINPESASRTENDQKKVSQENSFNICNGIIWNTKRIRTVADEKEDEIKFQEHENELSNNYNGASKETQKALFVLISPDQGIFYPPNSQVLSYDTSLSSENPVQVRCVSDELLPGAYIIVPILKEQPEQKVINNIQDNTSEIWKNLLRKEYYATKKQLCTILEYKGIKLENLLGCIERWLQPASNVISAPQSKEHFEKLMIYLGLNNEKGIEWCKRAWDDVRRSRGEAIQDGRIAHEEMETELAYVLNQDIENLKKHLQSNESIKYKIPTWSKHVGDLHLYQITNIQDGYRVDSNELYKFHNSKDIQRWRV
jgi:hypothetical protein